MAITLTDQTESEIHPSRPIPNELNMVHQGILSRGHTNEGL